jgi:type II secretory pathway component GspD/PulD (secretin)
VVEAQVVEPLDTRVFSLSFAKVEDAVKTVKEVVSARGKVIADSRTNNLIVTDTHANLAVIQGAIKAIDMITPQVLIQAKIIETDLATTQKLGIDWTIGAGVSGATHPTYWPFRRTSGNKYQPTYYTTATDGTILEHNAFPDFPSANFGVGTLNASALAATLEVLLNDSNTSIKSMPSITTLDNNTAGIKVVTKDPLPNYTYNSQTGQWEINGYTQLEYGVSLEVTPQINKEGFVTLVVKPNVSEVTGQRTFSSGGSGASVQIPILDEQTTVTKVMVRDGETLVIGGLIRDKVEEIVKKVPILGSIPVLDFFFKHKSKSVVKKNLLIFITPTIVTPSRGDSSAAPEAAAAAQEKAVAKVPVQVQATAQVPAKGQ